MIRILFHVEFHGVDELHALVRGLNLFGRELRL